MRRKRGIALALILASLFLSFPLKAEAGHCAGSSDCGCSVPYCSDYMVCWYDSPWSYCIGHNFGNTWTFISSSATCTESGYSYWRGYCSICQRWYDLYMPDGPLGHDWGSWQQHNATHHVRYCRRCGISDYGYHNMGAWYDGGNGWHYRSCGSCGYTERYDFTAPTILSFKAEPYYWSAGNGTVSLSARDWGSGINYILLFRTNANSGATDQVAKWECNGTTNPVNYTYKEYAEGVYYYTVHLYDCYGNHSEGTTGKIYLDHSNPVLYGMENTSDEWTNVAPVISVTATDYLAGTLYEGAGLESIVINNDEGQPVATGTNRALYTLSARDEGEHIFSIVAIDKVGHTTTETVLTRYDITPPGIDGTEVTYVKPDGTTVSGYCQDNIIDQHIDDDITRSANGANKSSGLHNVILYRVTGTEREAIHSDETAKTFEEPDTNSSFDMYYEIQRTEKTVSYYEIIVTDFAGNRTKKKLTSQYSLLGWFHTSIHRSSYD